MAATSITAMWPSESRPSSRKIAVWVPTQADRLQPWITGAGCERRPQNHFSRHWPEPGHGKWAGFLETGPAFRQLRKRSRGQSMATANPCPAVRYRLCHAGRVAFDLAMDGKVD